MRIASDVPQVGKKTLTHEELERIKAFRLPNFVPPYSYTRNPLADKAKAEAYSWVEEYSLLEVYKTPEELRAVYKADFAELAVVVYLDCGRKELAWAAKFYIWLFIFDDRMDENTNFCSPEESIVFFLDLHLVLMWSFPDDEEFYRKFVESLNEADVAERAQALNYLHLKLDAARQNLGTVYDTSSPQIHPLCKAFRDLWAELCETMPADFLRRWALLFQDELLENVREVNTRKNKSIPSVEEYIVWRRASVAAWVVAVVVEFLDKVHLPDKMFNCPEMQRFLNAASDAFGWHNDLWSFRKEALKGDVHNLVIVVSHEDGSSYAEAGMKVFQMMLNKLAEMENAIADLEKVTPREHQHAIARYSNWARHFLTGSHYWHDNCVRYKCA